MKRQRIYIPEYDWIVDIYYDSTPKDAKEIIRKIAMLGCSEEGILKTYEQLSSGILNNGFTYSNRPLKRSVMSLGRASSFAQFLNSFVHELHHLVTHIGVTVGLDLEGEDICYLTGDIAQKMYHILMHYISRCGL